METDIETKTVHDFLEKFQKLDRPKKDFELMKKALDFACRLHKGQKRVSQEPYIIHPLSVADILIELNCDTETICAGLLHDVLEDTNTDVLEVEKDFGPEIGKLVEGVTKLGKLSFMSTEEHRLKTSGKCSLPLPLILE